MATLKGGLAHDVSILLSIGRHLGSQPRANTSITIMRPPQRAQGHPHSCNPILSGFQTGDTARRITGNGGWQYVPLEGGLCVSASTKLKRPQTFSPSGLRVKN
jgi:hypothetical protein